MVPRVTAPPVVVEHAHPKFGPFGRSNSDVAEVGTHLNRLFGTVPLMHLLPVFRGRPSQVSVEVRVRKLVSRDSRRRHS